MVLGELGRGERGVGGQHREQRADVHAPLDPVRQPHNTDTTCPRYPADPRAISRSTDRVGTMLGAMATVDEVELLPDADQHKLLIATLERVNRASNAARAAALQAQRVRRRARCARS